MKRPRRGANRATRQRQELRLHGDDTYLGGDIGVNSGDVFSSKELTVLTSAEDSTADNGRKTQDWEAAQLRALCLALFGLPTFFSRRTSLPRLPLQVGVPVMPSHRATDLLLGQGWVQGGYSRQAVPVRAFPVSVITCYATAHLRTQWLTQQLAFCVHCYRRARYQPPLRPSAPPSGHPRAAVVSTGHACVPLADPSTFFCAVQLSLSRRLGLQTGHVRCVVLAL